MVHFNKPKYKTMKQLFFTIGFTILLASCGFDNPHTVPAPPPNAVPADSTPPNPPKDSLDMDGTPGNDLTTGTPLSPVQ